MVLKKVIQEIKKLITDDQYRLKEFSTKSLASYSASDFVFKDVSGQKHKGGYTCTHCRLNNVVRFGKYPVKIGMKTSEGFCHYNRLILYRYIKEQEQQEDE